MGAFLLHSLLYSTNAKNAGFDPEFKAAPGERKTSAQPV
jgi:hypothetical protein